MLTLKELRNRMTSNEIQIDEAQNNLPALLTLRRGAVRLLSDGRRIAEHHHADSGAILIFPMMFPKGDKR